MDAPKKYKDFNERWDWILAFMVLEDLFVHEILMMMDKKASSSVSTMGVNVEGSTIYLVYNKNFVDKLPDPELRYIITHEIYHIVLHHCTCRKSEDKNERAHDNIAADLAINSLIPESSQRRMPKGKYEGQKPAQYGFEEKLSKEQYLQLLRDQDNENKKDKKDKDKDKNNSGDSNDGNNDGDNDGDSNENNDGNNDGKDQEPEYGDGEGGSFDSHDGWNESAIAEQIIRDKIDQLSKNERVWGSMPGETKALILAAQKSQVSWTKYLRRYLGNMITHKTEPTITRPNKRYGLPFPGKKRTYADRKLVAIDTSGSIGDKELRQFLAEINKLSEIQPIDLITFDDGIQEGPKAYDRKRKSYNFTGRGGTSFKEVFEIAGQRRYASVIMLTDGCAGVPDKPASVRDVLWVLTGTGNPPVEWGKRVRIVSEG